MGARSDISGETDSLSKRKVLEMARGWGKDFGRVSVLAQVHQSKFPK